MRPAAQMLLLKQQNRPHRQAIFNEYGLRSIPLIDDFFKQFLDDTNTSSIAYLPTNVLNELTRLLTWSGLPRRKYTPTETLSDEWKQKLNYLNLGIIASHQAYLTVYFRILLSIPSSSIDTVHPYGMDLPRNSNHLIALLKLSHAINFKAWNECAQHNPQYTYMHGNNFFHHQLCNGNHTTDDFFVELADLSAAREVNIDWNAQEGRGDSVFLLLLRLPSEKNSKAALKLINKKDKTGVDINLQNKNGESPLHIAALTGNLKAYEALIAAGANTMVKDKDGKTPADYLGAAPDKLKQKINETYRVVGIDPTRAANAICDRYDGSEHILNFIGLSFEDIDKGEDEPVVFFLESPYNHMRKAIEELGLLEEYSYVVDVTKSIDNKGVPPMHRSLLEKLIEYHRMFLTNPNADEKDSALFTEELGAGTIRPLKPKETDALEKLIQNLSTTSVAEKAYEGIQQIKQRMAKPSQGGSQVLFQSPDSSSISENASATTGDGKILAAKGSAQ